MRFWFGYLFGSIFAGAGLIALYAGYQQHLADGAFSEDVIGLFAAGGIFALVGFAILLVVWRAAKESEQQEELKRRYPDEPWMHRPEWAAKEIPCGSKAGVIGAWVIAIVWNGISAAPIFAIPEELEKGNTAILIALLFPAVGLFILFGAIRATLQWRKYGNTKLRMLVDTGVLGGEFQAAVTGRTDLPINAVCEVKLQNLHKYRVGTGKNRRTVTKVLYEQQKSIPASTGNLRMGVPLSFIIPFDAHQTEEVSDSEWYEWKVDLSADVPGVDFEAQFEIPVFETSKSDSGITREQIETTTEHKEDFLPEFPQSEGVRFQQSGDSRIITFPAARKKRLCFGLFVTFFIILGVIVVLWKDAPIIFPIFLGFFDLLILYGLLTALFASKQVEVRPDEIRVADAFLLRKKIRNFRRDDIAEITAEMAPYAQQSPEYVAVLKLKNGESVQATQPVKDQREAKWFAEQMEMAPF